MTTESLWKWMDANEKQFGVGRPYLTKIRRMWRRPMARRCLSPGDENSTRGNGGEKAQPAGRTGRSQRGENAQEPQDRSSAGGAARSTKQGALLAARLLPRSNAARSIQTTGKMFLALFGQARRMYDENYQPPSFHERRWAEPAEQNYVSIAGAPA